MKLTMYMCDKCRSILQPGKQYLVAIQKIEPLNGEVLHLHQMDMCPECVTNLLTVDDPEITVNDVNLESGTEVEPEEVPLVGVEPIFEDEEEQAFDIPEVYSEEDTTEDEPKIRKARKPRTKIDWRKVVALKNSGRSNEWIADDMNIAISSIQNGLRRLQNQGKLKVIKKEGS